MKQGGGSIDTSALANGRGLSAGSPSVAPVWNSSASVKTSVGTPSSYIPSYTSWYPSTHQDSMQQPQLMWRQCLADPAPLPSWRTRMRGASDPAARLSGPQPIQYRLRSHTAITPEHTAQAHRHTGNNSLEVETLRKKRLRRRNKFSSFTFRADFPNSWVKWSCSWYFLFTWHFTVCKTLYKAVTIEKKKHFSDWHFCLENVTDAFIWLPKTNNLPFYSRQLLISTHRNISYIDYIFYREGWMGCAVPGSEHLE